MATYYGDEPIDNRPGCYYVSVIDGPRFAFALGPFDTHLGALLRVTAVQRNMQKLTGDPKAAFYGYGTSRIDRCDDPPQGRLNDLLCGGDMGEMELPDAEA